MAALRPWRYRTAAGTLLRRRSASPNSVSRRARSRVTVAGRTRTSRMPSASVVAPLRRRDAVARRSTHAGNRMGCVAAAVGLLRRRSGTGEATAMIETRGWAESRTVPRARPDRGSKPTGAARRWHRAGRLPVPDFGGEAAGVRRRAWRGGACGAFAGTGAAPRRIELRRRGAGLPLAVHPGSSEAGGVAPRPGLLQLCRPAQRAALRLPLSAGDRPHRAVRARRRCGAGELARTLWSAPQVAPCSAACVGRECADCSPARSGVRGRCQGPRAGRWIACGNRTARVRSHRRGSLTTGGRW